METVKVTMEYENGASVCSVMVGPSLPLAIIMTLMARFEQLAVEDDGIVVATVVDTIAAWAEAKKWVQT